ncbi:putative pentatricopeptide repeat-containing protein At1g03510 [Phalaenopsis equestris]|uniref:putative pentatricopeptide repeat-containing protein At1g03510 n=1 Tax=Phalaenopsis equestris TaxID=78828 RepID=UPI0009E402BF|nr:putative pentatricopeptide repeat-containing protein At1g03510 [Phalaenopsis equestris]XP_020572038.1 putative pentatricopeptide repeat-containing protein At1g03510 [Phalaenopsis equestris]XP_020572039.1 putative pentatricopeptide repeat-containing protein At1g03510 [Phalaenopsis equestris]XP_020572041.1 putative pentatricopeptide repeat-containing protein At1g03510 [Phalaenopsis equestris]
MAAALQSNHQKLVNLTRLLTSYVNNGRHHQALTLFSQMFAAPDLVLDPFAFPLALKSSAALRLPSSIASLHTHSLKSGLLSNPFISSSLVDAYGKCVSLADARQAFDESPQRNAVVWNAMISLYSHANDIANALKLLEVMDVPSTESSYNPIIAALSESEDSSGRAMEFYERMRASGLRPNLMTLLALLPVCLTIGSLSSIKEIHCYGFRSCIDRNAHLGSMLVEAYGRCGCLVYAREVFDQMPDRDVVVWSSMVSAYAFHGDAGNAMHVFREMEADGVHPDGIMFLAVLKACSHAGLADDALRYFEVITKVHGLEAGSDHYSCLVDVMSRAGRVWEGYEILVNMPVKATARAWGALLGACRKYGDVKLAEIAAKELFAIEPENSGNFMLLANTYAAVGRFEEAEKIRREMEERRVKRPPGSSWVMSRKDVGYGAQRECHL